MLNPGALGQVDIIEQFADRKVLYSQHRQQDSLRLIVKAILLTLSDEQRETVLEILGDGDLK